MESGDRNEHARNEELAEPDQQSSTASHTGKRQQIERQNWQGPFGSAAPQPPQPLPTRPPSMQWATCPAWSTSSFFDRNFVRQMVGEFSSRSRGIPSKLTRRGVGLAPHPQPKLSVLAPGDRRRPQRARSARLLAVHLDSPSAAQPLYRNNAHVHRYAEFLEKYTVKLPPTCPCSLKRHVPALG